MTTEDFFSIVQMEHWNCQLNLAEEDQASWVHHMPMAERLLHRILCVYRTHTKMVARPQHGMFHQKCLILTSTAGKHLGGTTAGEHLLGIPPVWNMATTVPTPAMIPAEQHR
jgi:hypothetical protein